MRIKCPKCHAAYDVPDKAFPKEKAGDKPQKMRCFKCKTVFSVVLQPATDSKPPVKIEQSYSASDPVETVSKIPEWTAKTTLDLGGFEPTRPKPSRAFFFISMTSVLAVAFAFFLFVASRNGWMLSPANLPEQISAAFEGPEAKPIPTEAAELRVEVKESSQLTLEDDTPILVVTGEVANPTVESFKEVVLNGRIVGDDGKVRFGTFAPCGRTFKSSQLKKTKRGDFNKLYLKKGEAYDCRIEAKSSRKYMLIFDNIPPDYSEKYKVEVRVVQARARKPQ